VVEQGHLMKIEFPKTKERLIIPWLVIPKSAKRELGTQEKEFKEELKRRNNDGCLCLHSGQSKNGTLYIGVTTNLIKRIYEHKSKEIKGFTLKYNVTQLVYYEIYFDIRETISREKKLKKWNRAWKLRLIEHDNPYWKDLYESL
jgi:putative endonuclease